MKLASIASGSSGNCIYVGNEDTHLLVDTGISKKRIVEGLKQIAVDPESLNGILITHEHIDHIQGLGVFLRKYKIPVYGTEETLQEIFRCSSLGQFDKDLFFVIDTDKSYKIGSIVAEPASIYHDAANPVCYTFSDSTAKAAVATDMGTYDDYLIERLQGCRDMLIESNHDLNMLMVGPYPYPLKRRIMGNQGHLSNERAGQLIHQIMWDGCQNIMLGHLSKENNYVDLAYETVKSELLIRNIDIDHKNINLKVASRTEPTLF